MKLTKEFLRKVIKEEIQRNYHENKKSSFSDNYIPLPDSYIVAIYGQFGIKKILENEEDGYEFSLEAAKKAAARASEEIETNMEEYDYEVVIYKLVEQK